jgi:hypothetical protein
MMCPRCGALMTSSPSIVCCTDGQRQYHHCSYCDKSLCDSYTFNNGSRITFRSAEPDEKLVRYRGGRYYKADNFSLDDVGYCVFEFGPFVIYTKEQRMYRWLECWLESEER